MQLTSLLASEAGDAEVELLQSGLMSFELMVLRLHYVGQTLVQTSKSFIFNLVNHDLAGPILPAFRLSFRSPAGSCFGNSGISSF